MVPRAKQELVKSFEPIIARVKRHDGHVKTQADEAHGQSPLVEHADIKTAEQYFITVVQVNAHARKNEDITQYNSRLKRDVDVHLVKLQCNIKNYLRPEIFLATHGVYLTQPVVAALDHPLCGKPQRGTFRFPEILIPSFRKTERGVTIPHVREMSG